MTHGRSWIRLVGAIALLTLPAALAAAPAFAALPYTYGPQRIDSPSPAAGARFGDTVVNVGDLNNDDIDDLAVGSPGADAGKGVVYLVSGSDGLRLGPPSIPSPDASTGGQPAGFGTSIARLGDVGGCPGFGGDPGGDCDAETSDMNFPDGAPDLVVGAPGVDLTVDGEDTGRVYVIDGASGAVLRRIDMPPQDRTDQGTFGHPAFGQSVLVPAGLPACVGNAGIGACDSLPPAVKNGDVDGTLIGGTADIVIGAPHYYETPSSPGCGAPPCLEAGRVYVYRGEALGGRGPSQPLNTPLRTIQNPDADSGSPTWFGYSLTATGDVGKCSSPTGPSVCPDPTNVPDGKPDFFVSAPRADNPDGTDGGVAYIVDPSTGRFVDMLTSPEGQGEAMFGFSSSGQLALGDAAGDSHYDFYAGAPGKSYVLGKQGAGFVLNGDVTVTPPSPLYGLSTLTDPTPADQGAFGGSWASVGDVAGAESGLDGRNELLVGTSGSPGVGDVHFLSALTSQGQVLQSISDPDGQSGSGFGRSIAPLGDVNGDGFLDFAVGAGGYGSGAGRLYILRSDNTPPPPPPPTPTPPPPTPTPPPGPTVLAGRSIRLDASRKRIRVGQGVRLKGSLIALANKPVCERTQSVEIQRRRPSRARYATFVIVTTDGNGRFAVKAHPPKTYSYRARVKTTTRCLRALSGQKKVAVRRKRSG